MSHCTVRVNKGDSLQNHILDLQLQSKDLVKMHSLSILSQRLEYLYHVFLLELRLYLVIYLNI